MDLENTSDAGIQHGQGGKDKSESSETQRHEPSNLPSDQQRPSQLQVAVADDSKDSVEKKDDDDVDNDDGDDDLYGPN